MIVHPAQSLFIGCFPMGAATLINAGLVSVLLMYMRAGIHHVFRMYIRTGRAEARLVTASYGLYGPSGGLTPLYPTPSLSV